MIYLDTSALIKLLRPETESEHLRDWLADRAEQPLVASALVEVEIPRALRRSEPGVLVAVAPLLGRLYRVEISQDVRTIAGNLPEAGLRSLDAVHLATAQLLTSLGQTISAFVVYDLRLAEIARQYRLPVEMPGRS